MNILKNNMIKKRKPMKSMKFIKIIYQQLIDLGYKIWSFFLFLYFFYYISVFNLLVI